MFTIGFNSYFFNVKREGVSFHMFVFHSKLFYELFPEPVRLLYQPVLFFLLLLFIIIDVQEL